MPIDYSSQSYWEARLAKERATGYEWLVPASTILPIISEYGLRHGCRNRILHFGCGSSFLGRDLQRAFGLQVEVSDADYATAGLQDTISKVEECREVPLLGIDVLSSDSLRAASPSTGWDLLVDKSTADAISCGPPCQIMLRGSPTEREAIEVMCDNLAFVTRPGARWVSISYSSERFSFMASQKDSKWFVKCKVPVKLSPSVSRDSNSIVYQPETGVWAWVLERV